MTELPIAPLHSSVGRPLFILSFRHRDELAAAVSRAGWRAIAARRAAGIERRFIGSGAAIAVVDARGAFDAGVEALRALADPAQANAAALFILLSRGDVERLDECHAAGATHYLASPFGEAELGQALRFAERHAERLAAGWRSLGATGASGGEELSWSLSGGRMTLSDALAGEIGSIAAPRMLYALLDPPGRSAAREALRRLRAGADATAFTHLMPGGNASVAHHLHRLPDGVAGTIEPLAPDVATRRRYRDALTGLADSGEARRWIVEAIRRGAGTGLLLISINRFELVNSAYGRAAGDALLKAAARRIERVALDAGGRRTLVARMAGAEFLIGVAPGMSAERVDLLAADIVEAVARPFISGADTFALGCRVGIAIADEDGAEVDGLLRRASAALAEAKEQDGAPIRRLSGNEAVAAAWDDALAADLRRALAKNEIEILFQPQVAVATGEIVGVEALARWIHPTYGALGAGTLFAAAERSDHIVELSEHIQRRAIAEAAAWDGALARLRLSVNIVAADIGRPGFAEHFLAIADAAGFPRVRLTVELTESGLIDDLSSAADLLAALRAGGCRVAIDDFGTGYSSLAYLKALPLDYLKIDKRLSEDITGSSRDRVVVRGVIEMARSLGLGVVAEGVETEEQLALLAEEGCTYYQGFLCAEPLSSKALAELVARADADH